MIVAQLKKRRVYFHSNFERAGDRFGCYKNLCKRRKNVNVVVPISWKYFSIQKANLLLYWSNSRCFNGLTGELTN